MIGAILPLLMQGAASPPPARVGPVPIMTPDRARPRGAQVSTLFDCLVGNVRNPDGPPAEWRAVETTPFALLIKREPGNNFAGSNQTLLTFDPARLLPIKPAYSLKWGWPAGMAVVGSAPGSGLQTFATRGQAEAPTFSTLSLDVPAKSARVTIVNLMGSDFRGPMIGNCKLEYGDPAVARFQEISK
ncbi:MAG TPA: hypothetical protein VEW26_06455 [Allosphingosinicella sp.]|nr:hypothetical protein [Allosphingosinicella sp.]